MANKWATSGAIVLPVVLVIAGARGTTGAQQLPDGPGKDVMVKMCGTCHPPERGASVRLTREGWQDVMNKMVSLGAKGTDEELETVLDYLATSFKGEAPKPLNMNSATAIELESVVGLLRKEAAALIAHRSKQARARRSTTSRRCAAWTSRRSISAAIAWSASETEQ